MQRILTLGTLAACLTSSLALAQSVVVPSAAAGVEGASSTSYPWNRTSSAHRIQYLYDSSELTTQGITAPVIINNLKWRANGSTTGSSTGGTYSNVTIQLGDAAVQHGSMTNTFATNRGANFTTVYTGSVTVAPVAGTSPNNWYVDVALTTPVLYDPTSGADLLVEVDFPLGSWGGGTSYATDSTSSSLAMCQRMYDFTSNTNATGSGPYNSGLVMEIGYNPAAGIFAGFSSDVQTGSSPLTVNFTDSSFTSDPGGIIAWAWDFDNDGTVDSTLQHPTYTYANCGTYDVSLTVFDVLNGSDTKLETAYIVTDAVTADFAEQLVGALTIQFTDTSTGTPTSWAWDLDGDGTIDATTQNTAWVYPNANPVDVSLTVNRLCGPPDTITRTIVPLQQLTTGLVQNNANGTGCSVLLDLDVLNPDGIIISGIDVYTSATVQTCNLDMYVRQGTYDGFESSPEEWVLAGTATGTSSGALTTPFNVAFNMPVYLPPGLSGVKFHARDYYNRYTTGSGIVTFGNADVTMTVGKSQTTSPTNPFTGNLLSPRWFAGTIYYETYNIGANAGAGLFGAGCDGSLGRPSLSYSGAPVLGTTMTVTVDNLPVDTAVLMNGFSKMSWALGPLPFDASILGAPGCFLRIDPMMNVFLSGSGNTASWSLTIPNWPSLAGLNLYQQAVVFDPAFNAASAVGSDAAGILFGN